MWKALIPFLVFDGLFFLLLLADWSLDFDIGMNFFEWHAPVPKAHEMGIFTRALKFLLNIQQGAPARRLNWTMTVNPLLDTSPENYHKWGVQKGTLNPENIGEKQYLRVELQTFFRLPRSNALVFPIRCYLASFDDLMTVPKWGRRLDWVFRVCSEEVLHQGVLRRCVHSQVGVGEGRVMDGLGDGSPPRANLSAWSGVLPMFYRPWALWL